MTNEQKQLLLKDLSARLPYPENWVRYDGNDYIVTGYGHGRVSLLLSIFSSVVCPCPLIEEVQPYLRPMSSMTEEEKEELKQEHSKDERLFAECLKNVANGDDSMRGKVIPHFAADWCNKNHFDYRGLIEKGLAIVVTEENNPYK